jgi:hypothetical protein
MPDDDEGTDLKYFYKPVDPLLKVYGPARWIRLKSGSFDRYIFKREARNFFFKSANPLSCESPLKLQHHLVQQ